MEHAIDTSSEPTGAEPEICAWPLRLDHLEIGKDAVVASVDADDQALRQHILDMGLTPGTEVTMMKYAPMGDPIEIRLRGYELTLRRADAARIVLANIHDAHKLQRENAAVGSTEHPALGRRPIAPVPAPIRFPRGIPSPLPSPAIRTAARPPCSTSSPDRASTWATFPA